MIAATAAGDSLCYRHRPGAVIVASEPCDDDPGWHKVPDGSVVEATTGTGSPVRPIAAPGAGCRAEPAAAGRSEREGGARHDEHPDRPRDCLTASSRHSLRADALAGLTATPKSLPPKWFYDERGSELFDKITRLDEYYPTRAEREILAAAATEIAAATRAATLVELGSGTADKTRLLLDALRDGGTLASYVPVDVSESALVTAASRMLERYRACGSRRCCPTSPSTSGCPRPAAPRLVAFLGGTIGNLLPGRAGGVPASLRARLRAGDALLLGTDLVKDPAVLVAAYDDAAGVTAEFNKNILRGAQRRARRPTSTPTSSSTSRSGIRQAEWIEMRLRSAVDQKVALPAIGLSVPFSAGEEMRTEISAKFRRDGVAGRTGRRRASSCGPGGPTRGPGSACRCRCGAESAAQAALDRPGPDLSEAQRAAELRDHRGAVDRAAAEQVDGDEVFFRPGMNAQM